MSIYQQRQIIRRLLDPNSPVDAPTAYYALHHDPARSTLATRLSANGRHPQGFVGRFQTGHDLFRPLVTLRCATPEVAADLLAEVLVPGRPYILFVNLNQLPLLEGIFQVENRRVLHIHTLSSARFKPVINVMVVEKTAPDGTPRYEIHSGGLQAVSGVNWVSPGFAEIYVHTEPQARERGWGRSVAAACTEHILREGRLPLYLVEEDNEASLELARSLGYADTNARQLYADVVYLGAPGREPVPVEEENDQTSR